MPPPTPLRESILFLIDPWLFMLESLSHLPATLFTLLLPLPNLPILLSPSRLQFAWFARFWASAGPNVRATAEARVIPLLEGRVSNGRVLAPHSPSPAGNSINDNTNAAEGLCGVVLEIGPASGLWASVFAHPSLRPRISHIYGIEPNPSHHAALRESIAAAGLGGTYEIVPCGIEDLASSGVQKGSVDCVVSVLCLCSIPEPERLVRDMFGYLKDGGRWFVYEHVRCGSERMRECGLGMRVYQGEFFLAVIFFLLSACSARAPISPLSSSPLALSALRRPVLLVKL